MKNIYPITEENIRQAAQIIQEGGLVSFPTETVYGLGADALDPMAAAKIFEAKERPFFDPLIVHIAEASQAADIFESIGRRMKQLMEAFWPGPLTIVAKKQNTIPDIITAGLDTVAVRMPDNDVARRLITAAGTPIAAPSANRFGSLSPTSARHVHDQLGGRVDLILDGGDCPVGIESTILKVEKTRILLLRPGGIPLEEIEPVIGEVLPGEEGTSPEAPGQLPYHYSPSKPVIIVPDSTEMDFTDPRGGFLLFHEPDREPPTGRVEFLTRKKNLVEAAANLFSCLHRLDKLEIEYIIAEALPREGLGLAVMDRLTKASKKHSGEK